MTTRGPPSTAPVLAVKTLICEPTGLTQRHAVYRHYAAAGELLYIGYSRDPMRRLGNHETKPWFARIARVEVEWFDTETEARGAERAAIIAEKPEYNIAVAAGEKSRQAALEALRNKAAAEAAGYLAKTR